MRDKWVDIDGYFGPDRRRRPGSKRWSERRHDNQAGDPPPLGALLRRLRVQMMGIASGDDRNRAFSLLRAAIGSAERQSMFKCADALKQADRLLRTGGAITDIEALVVEAANHAAANR